MGSLLFLLSGFLLPELPIYVTLGKLRPLGLRVIKPFLLGWKGAHSADILAAVATAFAQLSHGPEALFT